MKNKSSYSLELPLPRTTRRPGVGFYRAAGTACLLLSLLAAPRASANSDAPAWMHGLLNAPLPAHDEKTDAVVLYAEKIVTVQSADKIRTQVRLAYKILRPGGRGLGTVVIPFDSQSKINWLRAWCIPSQGRDYEVKDPVVFEGPSQDTDTFEITLPAGYEVDDLPQPVSAEYAFASYHSKAEVSGNVLRYTRTFEIKDPSVPLSKVNDLKTLYRIIASDERNTAVLKPAGKL